MFKRKTKDGNDDKKTKEALDTVKKEIEKMTKGIADKEAEIALQQAKVTSLREEAKELLKKNDKDGAERKLKLMQNVNSQIKTSSQVVNQLSTVLASLETRREQIELKMSATVATKMLDNTAAMGDQAADLLSNIREHEQMSADFLTQLNEGDRDKASAIANDLANLMAEIDEENFADIPVSLPGQVAASNDLDIMVEI
ncbi:hypothetical protein GL50803_007843 [Giardia duodenalis]|uniref:Uncharacterized protein n=1 Tax=Giardia intestinalis (strain ATCC 50803 / WB clone C6) TaxID=184922 RepID=A8B4V8_GIAIC|nr:hypothetical protein GL50803_007843 [Giardia intestinalis]KAE8303783.1 hypothetical protein GL50803_007843 [Giardia intestinalis]|eukprot:XP_001709708.1 Hypothetical protein GL50803_7843 [Giardia lamblia ATCC 50803]